MYLNKLETKEDLEKVFIELNEDLYKYIYFRCGYNKDLAQDLTQEIFIKAWEKKDLFDSRKSSLKNWLYVMTRNHLIDYFRKKKYEVNFADEVLDNIVGESINIDKVVLGDILKSMDLLNEAEKEVLVLRYIEDLDIKSISEIVGKNYIATKVYIHRSLKYLKKILNERGYTY